MLGGVICATGFIQHSKIKGHQQARCGIVDTASWWLGTTRWQTIWKHGEPPTNYSSIINTVLSSRKADVVPTQTQTAPSRTNLKDGGKRDAHLCTLRIQTNKRAARAAAVVSGCCNKIVAASRCNQDRRRPQTGRANQSKHPWVSSHQKGGRMAGSRCANQRRVRNFDVYAHVTHVDTVLWYTCPLDRFCSRPRQPFTGVSTWNGHRRC